jgi:metal-responsive CopG/Arc/MetJ family transcriptional regulator
MATTKERILITLTPDMARELTARAKREKSPRATVAARMLRDVIEDISDEEDRHLSALGEKRLRETKRWLTSEEFWGKMSVKKEGKRKS